MKCFCATYLQNNLGKKKVRNWFTGKPRAEKGSTGATQHRREALNRSRGAEDNTGQRSPRASSTAVPRAGVSPPPGPPLVGAGRSRTAAAEIVAAASVCVAGRKMISRNAPFHRGVTGFRALIAGIVEEENTLYCFVIMGLWPEKTQNLIFIFIFFFI